MPKIKYVCLSDTHLGEEDSLLTNLKTASTEIDPKNPSPVMEELVKCLKNIIGKSTSPQKPTLVLNGDILEMALTTTEKAAMVFVQFIKLLMPQGNELFDRIVYVPGNHDHHLWETARETQYVDYLSTKTTSDILEEPWHTTKMFETKTPFVKSYFLTKLIRRLPNLNSFKVEVAYPNYGFISNDRKKSVVFHHGHFIEPIYHLMSTLRSELFPDRKTPTRIWQIEKENFAWIDFFWSTMGRSGNMGSDVEMIYEKMYEKKAFRDFLSEIAINIARKHDIPYVPGIPFVISEDKVESKLLTWVFDKLVEKMYPERNNLDDVLSEKSEKGLRSYMNTPLYNQIINENSDKVPEEVTFVFGHTHKPLQRSMNLKSYPSWVNVYNTGGWVVESTKPEPKHGGAIILVDEDLNSVSLRMYNENEEPDKYIVKVEDARHPGTIPTEFYEKIVQCVDADKDPWKGFSDSVAKAVNIRAQNLSARIYEK